MRFRFTFTKSYAGWRTSIGDRRIRAKFPLILGFALVTALGHVAGAQSVQQPASTVPEIPVPTLQGAALPVPEGASISGTVVDQDGEVVRNVRIVLSRPGLASNTSQETLSDTNGYFIFTGVTSGPFQLSLTAPGFALLEKTGVLQGEDLLVTPIALLVAPADVAVEVKESQEQVAEDQVKVQEKQRLFGVIPNYYVSYVPNAAPLTTKLKFQLAWKSTVDPVSFAITGVVAGIGTGSGYLWRLRTGHAGLCQALRRRLRRLRLRNIYWRRNSAGSIEAGSALLLERNGRHEKQSLVCHRELGDLQGRQWAMATELLCHHRGLGRGRHLEPVLSRARPEWGRINLRKRTYRDRLWGAGKYRARIFPAQDHTPCP